MIVNIIIGGLIFCYAGWTLWKFIKKANQGKCASCELKSACSAKSCCSSPISNAASTVHIQSHK